MTLPISTHIDLSSLTGGEHLKSLAAGSENSPEQLQHVAQEFDAVFYSMLLKEMRQTVGEDGLFSGDHGDTLGGLFDLFMGRHLAQSSELGIGRAVTQYLEVADVK